MGAALADVVVVGLGAAGSAVLRHLARGGATVVGIDRHRPPHDKGSSHGGSRITRLAIGEGHAYVPLVQRSHVLWRELEVETGARLMETTGGLVIGAPAAEGAHFHGRPGFFERTLAAAERFDIAHERLDAAALERRWPALRPRGDERGYFEPEAGVLKPEACVEAQLESAARAGAVLRFDEAVQRLEPLGTAAVRIVTDRATFEAAQVVLACGAWLPSLLSPDDVMPFRIQRQVMHWFATNTPELYRPGRFPVFIWMHGAGAAFYGMPMVDGRDGVKVATEQDATTTTAETVERRVDASEVATVYDEHVRGRLVGVMPRSVHAATCLYTTLPEGRFLVDRHPALERVTVLSACSGHGFKHTAALGEAVADGLLGRERRVDLAPFSWAAMGSSSAPLRASG